MINLCTLRIVYWAFAAVVIVLFTLFAPEMIFHKTYKNEKPELFGRWRDKRLAWNLHQSFIHLIGSLAGFLSFDILLFQLGINDPSKYNLKHLILFLFGLSGIMGFIPRILFGSTVSK